MNAEYDHLRPRARVAGVVVQALPDELLIYDLVRHQAHCLNQVAALIWKHCDGQTCVAEMGHILREEMKAPVPEAVVWLALQQLKRAYLLAEPIGDPTDVDKVSRRQVMRQLGWGATIALPLVASIVAPTAVEAATCLPVGSGCTTGAQCCSGICTGVICV